MTSPRVEKLRIANTILAVLEKSISANRQSMVSSLKLESGFTDKVIQDIINDLIVTQKISSKGPDLTKNQ